MRKKGFTLIEVALVLAIAGLIFMMVFITLPQVWRTQRDTQRRDDMLTFVQRLKNFQTNNNRGALPSKNSSATTISFTRSDATNTAITPATDKTSWQAFYRDFFDDSFTDPVGEPYKIVVTKCTNSARYDQACDISEANAANNATFPNEYKIYVVEGAKCNGEQAVGAANTRKVAVLYKLEGGGVYCGES
ncbi:type II secretion system protein [Candidatus Saccharibacteria bacterium]|nr:type II secretion system protein [Candidatus Saccharibacteria bacterium]